MMDKKKFGGWVIKVSTQLTDEEKEIFDVLKKLIGATYTPIAHLGTQVVNGINHAFLAEQTIICANGAKNIVLVIINKSSEINVLSIEDVLKENKAHGGISVNPTTDIPAEAKKALDKVLENFVGAKVNPFAFLGTQVVTGINYFFAAEVTPLYPNAETSIALVVANDMCDTLEFSVIL